MRYEWDVSATRQVKDFFANLKHAHSTGTKLAGIDFAAISPSMLEAEMMWTRGQNPGYTWRPWVNYVPRNHRSHFMVCNYCIALPKTTSYGRGIWQIWPDGYAHRRYVIRYETFTKLWWIEIPARFLDKPRVWKRKTRAKLVRPKIDFLRQLVYPFETDGLNVRPGDLIHCLLCAYSILVEEMDEQRRLTRIREIDFLKDTRKLFSKLRDAYLRGELEKTWQEEQDALYVDSFLHAYRNKDRS